MFTIVDRQELTKRDMISLTVEAPAIARRIRPGQFVILRVNETGERLPLTVAYGDAVAGTITIIFQVVGKSTALLASLPIGDAIRDLAGPLGAVMEFEDVGTVVGIGGGSGIAVLHHLLIGYKEAGNRLIGIVGAREKDLLILEDEMVRLCDRVIPTTDDGSYGMHGLVTDALTDLVEHGEHLDLAVAVGPLVMMRAVCQMTKLYDLPTIVSLNPIMIDVRRLSLHRRRGAQVRLRRRPALRRAQGRLRRAHAAQRHLRPRRAPVAAELGAQEVGGPWPGRSNTTARSSPARASRPTARAAARP